MGSWIKLESDIITNAKVGQAGENGDRLYFCLLALHAKHGSNGRIPASRCTPAGLRIEAVAVLGRLTVAKIARAIADCVQVGLIELEHDGAVRLCGFDVRHMPECSRCHQPNPEPSHGTCPACRDQKREERRANSVSSRRAEKGMPSAAGGQKGASLSLSDRIEGEGIGLDGIGRMDGRMDGGVPSLSQNQNTDGVGTRLPSRPTSAGSILRQIAGGAS